MPRASDAVRLKPFFRVVSTDDARAAIRRAAPVGTETIGVRDAVHRVLATDLAAPIDLPHFHRANMDGYAVRAADTFGASPSVPAYLKIVGTVEMGTAATGEVEIRMRGIDNPKYYQELIQMRRELILTQNGDQSAQQLRGPRGPGPTGPGTQGPRGGGEPAPEPVEPLVQPES